MDANDIAALVHRNLAEVNRHDTAAATTRFAEGVVIEDLGMCTRIKGRDNVIAEQRGLFAAFPDLHGEVVSVITDGSRAAIEYVFEGTHSGPIALPGGQTLPATARRVAYRFVSIAEINDAGQITAVRRSTNPASLFAQLGDASSA